jgi:RNA polymerase sigma factor (sigma-70 family)
LYRACCSAELPTQTAGFEVLARYLYRVALFLASDQVEAVELARDCTQNALIYIVQHLDDCREPAAFRSWARRIVSNMTIDELRRRKRVVPLIDDDPETTQTIPPLGFEARVLAELSLTELSLLIERAPISARSRRVVLGRYLADRTDLELAQHESELSGQVVLASHVQVTRAKDIGKLRQYPPLRVFFHAGSEEREA